MNVVYLNLTLWEQFGAEGDEEAMRPLAFQMLPMIAILRQRVASEYPKTLADALMLNLIPKTRRVKEDAPQTTEIKAVGHLCRLWRRHEIGVRGSNLVSISASADVDRGLVLDSLLACADTSGNTLAQMVEEFETALRCLN